MNVSVIIPTYNGAHKLPAILDAIKSQNIRPFEVIVVVDGSTDNTLQVLKDQQRTMPELIIIEQENRGRAAVRNRGAEEAKGDLLLFFDDDMQPLNDCINVHLAHHLHVSDSVLTGAQIDLKGKDRSDIQKFKSSLSSKWSKPLEVMKNNPLAKDQVFITAANFSIGKKLFFRLGGFDERLLDTEDFDLAVRAIKDGVKLFYNSQAFAWHNDPITCATFIRRLRQYAKAHKRLVELKPWIREEGYMRPLEIPKGWRKNLFKLFTQPWWIKVVDEGRFKYLPKPVRYKLYDMIITSNGVYFPEKANV